MKFKWLLVLGAGLSLGLMTTTVQASSYYTTNPGIIKTKKTVAYYNDASKTKKS